jgi:hypothetical protein
VQRRLGVRRPWDGTAAVWVRKRTVETADGEGTVWDAGVSRHDVARTARGIWFGQIDEFIRVAITYHVVRDIAEAAASANGGSLQGRPIPFWFYAGLAQLLNAEQRLDYYRTTAKAIEDKRSYLLEDLFAHNGWPGDEADPADAEQRAIFLQQSATVVDFLLGSKRGSERLRGALQNLYRRSGFMLSLRLEFEDLYPSLDKMQTAWETYVHERPLHALGEVRLTLAETDALLEEILTVTIPVIDDETIEQSEIVTDFNGLSLHENRAVVNHICNEKAERLLQVTLRSAPEFKPALEAYSKALTAIRDGHRRSFKRWFRRAQEQHEAVHELPYFTSGEGE